MSLFQVIKGIIYSFMILILRCMVLSVFLFILGLRLIYELFVYFGLFLGDCGVIIRDRKTVKIPFGPCLDYGLNLDVCMGSVSICTVSTYNIMCEIMNLFGAKMDLLEPNLDDICICEDMCEDWSDGKEDDTQKE